MATIGLGLVLLLLGGFGALSALSQEEAASELREARLRASAFAQLRNALDDERLIEHAHSHGQAARASLGRGELSARFEAAAIDVSAALAEIREHGSARDRAFAGRVESLHERYAEVMRRQITDHGAVTTASPGASGHGHGDGGATEPAASTESSDGAGSSLLAMQAPLRRVQDRLRQVDRDHSASSLAKLRSLHESSEDTLKLTFAAFPLSLVLFSVFALVLRGYRKKEEAATRKELALLEQIALTDNLTGLRNHRAFHDDLTRELRQAERSGAPLVLVMLDVDGLKQVNDRFGHQEGDRQLRALAACLTELHGAGDASYRIGGDEFALLLPGETAIAAMRRVQRVLSKLSGGSRGHRPSASAGIAEAEGPLGKDELVRRADMALYDARRYQRPVRAYSGGLEEVGPGGPAEHSERHMQMLATSLTGVTDSKDSSTRSHSETVGELCGLIAAEMGMEADRVARLRLAGRLHDVGKVAIPDRVLQKPGPLTAAEHELIKTHSAIGSGVLQAAGLHEEAEWVLHHHERPDGSGYPDGLTGEEIPIESRLILAADAFEAMTGERPYRSATSVAEALSELEAHAGTQFDPECVAAMRRVMGVTSYDRALSASPER